MKELIDRVIASESTKEIWRNKHNSPQWMDANELSKSALGKSLNKNTNCECLEDLFRIMRHRQTKKRVIMSKEKRFKVKPNSVIMVHGCKPVTEHSSDEDCIKLLKMHKVHISSFASYPENWEEIVFRNAKSLSVENQDEAEGVSDVEEIEEEFEEENQEETTNLEGGLEESINSREEQLNSMKNAELKKLIPAENMPEKKTKPELVKAILAIEFKA